ncbi:hypothetical protein BC826DRAFT_1126082 [Russula brevipes]|nr:hypothetical protein BC826DRAFT_1126082 [Russula brevipes]
MQHIQTAERLPTSGPAARPSFRLTGKGLVEMGPKSKSPVTQISVVGLLRFLPSGNLNPSPTAPTQEEQGHGHPLVGPRTARSPLPPGVTPSAPPHPPHAPRASLPPFYASPVSTTTSTSTSTAIIAMLDMPGIAEILMEKEVRESQRTPRERLQQLKLAALAQKQQKRASTGGGARGAEQDSDDGELDVVLYTMHSVAREEAAARAIAGRMRDPASVVVGI